jgi:O-antigen ligase
MLSTLLGAIQGGIKIGFAIFYFLKYIEYFIIFFMVFNNVKSERQIKIFLFFLLLTCFVVAAYGWKMHFGGQPGLRISAPFEGTEGEPNTLGGYLLLMMAVIIGLFLYTRPGKLHFSLLGLLGFITPPFLFTLSRSAWLGFFPAYLTLLVLTKRKKMVLLSCLILLIFFSNIIFPKEVKERVEITFQPGKSYNVLGKQINFDYSSSARIDVWKDSLKRWSERPIFGYGITGGGLIVDSQYARLLVEVGLAGMLAFIWLMATIYRIAWESFKNNVDNRLFQGLTLGFMAGLSGLLTQGLTTGTFVIVRIMEPFWFLTALVAAIPKLNPTTSKN